MYYLLRAFLGGLLFGLSVRIMPEDMRTIVEPMAKDAIDALHDEAERMRRERYRARKDMN